MDPYDLSALFRFRERICSLPSDGPSRLSPTQPIPAARRIALLSGSFNPPTSAHTLMAERALNDECDAVVYLVPVAPAGKQPTGLMLEDRLLLLGAAAQPGSFTAVSSAGLYWEQAQAAAAAFPDADITFLAGSDKLEQVFDAAWYDDRDDALERLFGRARMLVSPRGESAEAVRQILEAPANRRFAHRVSVLPLHPAVGDLSSTRVRGLLCSGAEPSGLVPAAVASFCVQTRVFCPPDPDSGVDAYALRVRLFQLLWTVREWAEAAADFRGLMATAVSRTTEGERLRAIVSRGAGADLASV